jgi:lambda family phage portal protein
MADPTATFTDRVVEGVLDVVAPRRARLRAHRRRMENDAEYAEAFGVMARLRGYKAADMSKNKTPWLHASDRSADAEIVPSLPTLRNRSRAARRDDSIATGVFGAFTTNVVGTGRTPQATIVLPDGRPASEKNKAVEAVWWERCDHLSPADGGLAHAQRQALLFGKRLEDGDVLERAVKRTPDEPVWIETVEGQRLRTPAGALPRDPKGRIVNGVEKDRFGVVVAYWVCKHDPGNTESHDTVGTIPDASISLSNFDRVPVGPGVLFSRRAVTRPGQSRGVPLLHACLQDVHDLDLLFVAALKRTQMAACLALFIKSTVEGADLIELTAEDYGYQLDQKITPGMIFRLMPGEDVTTVAPNLPFADLGPLFMLAARRIGAAVGLSPQTVLRMWDGTTYSGARTIQLDDRNTYRCEGYDFDAQVLAWEWRVVLEDALLRGDPRLVAAGVTLEDLAHVEWIGDGEPWIDPMVEAQSTQLMLQLRLTTYQRECARQGLDWRKTIRDHLEVEAYEAEERAKRGLPARAPEAPALKVVAGGKPADDGEDQAQDPNELEDEQAVAA